MNEVNLCKIIYFDEGSVTDYIQIVKGGKLEKTAELLSETNSDGNVGCSAKASVGIGGVLKALVGFEVNTTVQSELSAGFNTSEMVKNIVKNTILTDFIELVSNDENDNNSNANGVVEKFSGYKIYAPKDSMSYFVLISPYLSMFKDSSGVQAGDFDIAIDKFDTTLKNAKGYYEFIGIKDKEKIIFRFNIKSFRNNYKATDLPKMDLSIYAIKVGTSTLEKLNFSNEFELEEVSVPIDNPEYVKEEIKDSDNVEDTNIDVLDVYDVLLAGVENND